MASQNISFNIFDFIEKQSQQSGEILINKDNFPRVFDDFFWETNNANIANDANTSKSKIIKYNLKAYTQEKIIAENGEKQLDYFLIMQLNGELVLQCQRCLKAMQFDLCSKNLYKFELTKNQVATEIFGVTNADEDLNNDDFDIIYINENQRFSDNNFQLNSFVEDEIILTLPNFPMHKHCDNKQQFQQFQQQGSFSNQPFSNLKNLLNQQNHKS